MISRYHNQIDLYYRYHDIVSMKKEIKMTNMSLILKKNGFEKVAESKEHIAKFEYDWQRTCHLPLGK